MSSALIGQDRWGLLSIKLALLQSQCPCSMTAIQLAVETLVACPGSHALVRCNRCWLAF
jgi:hypothetical protein